jgi:lysozyme
LSDDEIDYLLNNDINKRKNALIKALPWMSSLSEARQGVLINMSFQMGVDGLLKFTNTLAYIKAGKYLEASKGMLNSLWARQTPARALRLSKQMETNEWQ